MRTWIMGLVAAAMLSVTVPAASRAAEQSCPTCTQVAQGDALSIFLALLQSAPPGAFTYAGANSLGPTAFELTGVVVTPEGPGSAIPIQRLLVENIDLVSMMQGGAPSVLKMRIEGMTLSRRNTDIDDDFWEIVNRDELLTNVVLDMTSDAVTRAFTLNDLTLDLPGLGLAQVKLDMLGAGMEAIMAPEEALYGATLRSASVTLDDRSILGLLFDAGMRETGESEQALLDEILQSLADGLADMGAQPGDRVFQAGAALGGWFSDARSPKGPLTFSLSPAQPVAMAALENVAGAGEAAELLNLQVSYAGSSATLPEGQSGDYGYGSYVYTDMGDYRVGEVVTVYWVDLPGNQHDRIAVVPYDAPRSEFGQWTYSNGQTEGSFQVSGLAAGEYEIRLFLADAPDLLQTSNYFTVVEAGSQQQGALSPTLGTDKAAYKAGEPVIVFWAGLPGNQQDWVTVVPAGTATDQWGDWTYTSGQPAGVFQVNGLAAGDYEARVYYDYPNGGFNVQAVSSFTVQN